MSNMNPVEPWLREIDLGLHPALAQPIFALDHVLEDLEHHTAGLTDTQVWASPHGLTPLGFHLRHIAGSTDRLTTYVRGGQLNEAQIAQMKQEKTPGPTLETLLSDITRAVQDAQAAIRALHPDQLGEPRFIGRKRIRTTAVGLAIHIGEHAQRHVGQLITTCQILRAAP
jgi:hypothetical protein